MTNTTKEGSDHLQADVQIESFRLEKMNGKKEMKRADQCLDSR